MAASAFNRSDFTSAMTLYHSTSPNLSFIARQTMAQTHRQIILHPLPHVRMLLWIPGRSLLSSATHTSVLDLAFTHLTAFFTRRNCFFITLDSSLMNHSENVHMYLKCQAFGPVQTYIACNMLIAQSFYLFISHIQNLRKL